MVKKQSATRKSARKSASKKTSARAIAAKKSSARKSAAKKSVTKSAVKTSATKKAAGKSPTVTAAARTSSPSVFAQQIEMQQSSEYLGHNLWKWSVWIAAPEAVMDEIEYVEYKLHSSFPEPIQRRTDRDDQFRLRSSGWGEFNINAEIKPKNGRAFTKRHWLSLEYPAASPSDASVAVREKSHTPKVFVSAGVSDLRLSNSLAEALRQNGITVFKGDEVSSDLPWDVAILEMIKAADLMVVLLSGRPTSWIIREIYAAMKRNLTIVPVLIGPDPMVPDELKSLQPIIVENGDAPDKIAPRLALQVMETIKTLPPKR
jgi:pYEATS domain-containing protein involved in immunity/TIR domain-containing protein